MSIVKDLTTRQREIYREVARKTIARTREEVADFLAYKVVWGQAGVRVWL